MQEKEHLTSVIGKVTVKTYIFILKPINLVHENSYLALEIIFYKNNDIVNLKKIIIH